MARVYNFSAGPSMLPESVLKKAAAEMLDYEGSGQSVMEMSHRSKIYGTIIEGAEALLREVMNIPDNYKVLFLQGGASTQFAAIPLNLMNGSGKADYVLTGQWATKAYKEAARYGEANVVASSKDKTFSYIPKLDPSTFTKDADYFYICMNNTIYGTVYHEIPETGNVPLVADISSCILSTPLDISKFGMVYAGAQKNMAPAGLTVVIIREDLIGHARDITPTMLDYKTHADNGSMFNTLGMEIQPKNMTEEEKALCKNAIAEYKTIRPVVQLGDIYRLISPYDKQGVASLMYVAPEKDRAVFYWWKTEHFCNQHLPRVKMAGLCADKQYRVHELNRIDNVPLNYEGKVFSGAYLMANGLEIPYNHRVDYHKQNDYSSRVLYLEEVK